ncbi:MAG: cytochrome c oxidase assembly protein [Acidimicrobiia bacterium]
MTRLLESLPLAAGLLVAVLYARALLRTGRPSRSSALAFFAGMLAVFVALLPPVDSLAEHSLTAHMIQHELLFVAPLLLLAGNAGTGALLGIERPLRGRVARWVRWVVADAQVLVKRHVAWALLVTSLAVWHLPAVFDATLSSALLHGLEHLSFFGVGLTYWASIVGVRQAREHGYGGALASLFLLSLVGTAGGALLAFATAPWYPVHSGRATAAGLDWLTDQQLAGLVMWIPMGLLLISMFIGMAMRWLRSIEAAASVPGPRR